MSGAIDVLADSLLIAPGATSKNKIIKNGDLVKIDTGAYLDGFHGIVAYQFV